jgi:hypothetical protein
MKLAGALQRLTESDYGEAILWLIMTIENAWVDVFDRARATANCLVVRTRRRIAVLPAAASYRASGFVL